jgi:16S rRNA (adenine1518-N6/adenine1519-N6)-dimethyltransferase
MVGTTLVVEPKKSLGQHWLHDNIVLDAIVQSATVTKQDTIIEIGPGLGTLTEKLLATGATVIAIEFDESLLGGLRAKYANRPNFQLVYADVLGYDLSTLPKNYKIVANIPYYLTSQLLRILSDTAHKPTCAALLMQKEVTKRVCS